jgi:hypothetical protein
MTQLKACMPCVPPAKTFGVTQVCSTPGVLTEHFAPVRTRYACFVTKFQWSNGSNSGIYLRYVTTGVKSRASQGLSTDVFHSWWKSSPLYEILQEQIDNTSRGGSERGGVSDGAIASVCVSSIYWTLQSFFASQTLHNINFFKKKIRRCK